MAVLSWLSILGILLLLSYHHVFGGLKLAQLRRQGIRMRHEESARLLTLKSSDLIGTSCKALLETHDGGRSLCSWSSAQGPSSKHLSQLTVQKNAAASDRILLSLPHLTSHAQCDEGQSSLLQTKNARPLSEESLTASSLCSALPATSGDTLTIWGNLSASHLSVPSTLKTLVVSGYIESQKLQIAGDLTLLVGGDILINSYESMISHHITIVSMTGRIEAAQVSSTIHPTFIGYHDSTIPAVLSSSQRQLLNPVSHFISGLMNTAH